MSYINPPSRDAVHWRSALRCPPSQAGWYPCSLYRDLTILRYWDGRNWSAGTHMSLTARQLGTKVRRHHGVLPIAYTYEWCQLEWTDPWW